MAEGFSFQADRAGERLDVFLSRASKMSRSFVQAQIELGHVLRNGKATTKDSTKLAIGDVISGNFVEEASSELKPVAHDLDVLYEDENILAINKAQGVVVHPAAGHRGETLVHYLLHYFQNHSPFKEMTSARPGIVHRLDKGTSGVLLIAKDRKTQEALSAAFKSRNVKKEYRSIVWGKTGIEGSIASEIGRDTKHRKQMSSRTKSGRAALTHWKRISYSKHFSSLALFPHTGRTHQLRVHLAESGHPIVADSLYKGAATPHRLYGISLSIKSLLQDVQYPFLHAHTIAFEHPIKKVPIKITAEEPEIFQRFLEELKSND